MMKIQFRVLYREFLFRMVDLEILSAQGDMSKLLGQFAALLLFISALNALSTFFFDTRFLPAEAIVAFRWGRSHSLIATTMLVVGLFSVLSWDSTFPDRRDVLVLAPLPVRARTLFLAKVSALATALSLTVIALNGLSGLAFPVFVLAPPNSGVFGLIRSFAAYWIAMFAAGGFIFCSVLGVQGLAAQLPRQRFLRFSAFLQLAAFCLFLSVYLLQPSLASPRALAAAQTRPELAWLPSYWFWGLFHVLNGSAHPAMAPLARRAWIGFAIAGFGAASAFLLSYFRTLRKIVEEPDIVPGSRGWKLPLRFGTPLQTAVTQFSIRTLLRSRQHRVVLAFYLGIGFTVITLPSGVPADRLSIPMMVSSVVMLCCLVIGTRVVFARPLDLRANWIFRVTAVRGGPECLSASRTSLLVLAVAPVWAASALLFLWFWPWRPAVGHVIVLGLVGLILAEICIYGFQKIPFTCSYLPGKSKIHLAFLAAVFSIVLIVTGVRFERRALEEPAGYFRMLLILGAVAAAARWRTAALAKSEDAIVRFEDMLPPAVQVLGLNRDGVIPMDDPTPVSERCARGTDHPAKE